MGNRSFKILGCIIFIVAVLYLPTLQREGFRDERILLSFQTKTQDTDSLLSDLLGDWNQGKLGEVRPFWRPLTRLSFRIHLIGEEAARLALRLGNITLHIAIVLLVFALARLNGATLFASALASLIFGLHPIAPLVVGHAAGRADLLVTLFLLISTGAIFSWFRHGGKSLFWASLISFLLACLCKETAWLFPLALWPLLKNKSEEIIDSLRPFLAVVLLLLFIRVFWGCDCSRLLLFKNTLIF